MPQISDFSILDLRNYEFKKKEILECQEKHINQGEDCSKCKMVATCPKIKEFVNLEFDINLAKLKLCQEKNSLKSCFDCEEFFTCEIRHNYVKSTYNKMNEGRGGDFDF